MHLSLTRLNRAVRSVAASRTTGLLLAATAAPALLAQDNAADEGAIEEIVVTGKNVYRDRTDDINPTLSFGLDFFQRFEPLTVGEMLKRTPGVVFSSDVLEYDAVQLRGMSAEYTQVMINGRRVPGQGADRTFFVDRIPSELVESIEIIRSPSADMAEDGVAGTLNIILKDGAQLEGILGRLNTTYYGDDDRKFRNTGAIAIADASDRHDLWLGFNAQERRNPKQKIEEYYDDSALEGFAFEDDTRDGTDYSLNGAGGWMLDNGGELRLNGYYVLTDRQETEFVDEFEGSVVSRNGDLVVSETQREQIDQTSWGLNGSLTLPMGAGTLDLSAGLSGFDEDTDEFETEEEFEDGVSQGIEEGSEQLNIEDDNLSAEIAYSTPLNDMLEIKSGLSYRNNERDGVQAGILFDIEGQVEETIIAPYSKLTLAAASNITIEGGLRYSMYERDVSNEDGSNSADENQLLPSVSLRWDLSENDRFIASVARTVRRPDFDLVSPFEEDETPDDEHLTIGNPNLETETSLGVDIGYEHRLDGGGIMGINVFYRDVEDLIEISDTGVPYPDGGGSVFTPQNIGDGEARGVEFDISTPLDFIGLPDTGFYMNYAYMDSAVIDPFTGEEREFRNQPGFVYNISLTQDLPAINGGAGISYQKRDEALATEFAEYVITEYDGNLEFFVEMNLLENTVLRFSGTNLLDQEKIEYIRDFGEAINEIQYEQSSPTYTLTLRTAF